MKRSLKLQAAGYIPDDADGTLAYHVAELEQRVRRIHQCGDVLVQVRLSPAVLSLRAASEAAV
ncbi:MAG: hypothetical protein JXA69_18190 [Phycisphaerae bacterium]|nr:hypothetical protein [Phycisphaerae bacterium]